MRNLVKCRIDNLFLFSNFLEVLLRDCLAIFVEKKRIKHVNKSSYFWLVNNENRNLD